MEARLFHHRVRFGFPVLDQWNIQKQCHPRKTAILRISKGNDVFGWRYFPRQLYCIAQPRPGWFFLSNQCVCWGFRFHRGFDSEGRVQDRSASHRSWPRWNRRVGARFPSKPNMASIQGDCSAGRTRHLPGHRIRWWYASVFQIHAGSLRIQEPLTWVGNPDLGFFGRACSGTGRILPQSTDWHLPERIERFAHRLQKSS